MQKSALAIALASLLTPISYLHANEAQPQETVVVTANRFEQVESSVLSSVTVVSRQEIEAYQANSLTEVLRRVPGVEIAQNGGRGHSASVLYVEPTVIMFWCWWMVFVLIPLRAVWHLTVFR